MSDRSARIAACAKKFLREKPIADATCIKRNQLLDEGFQRLSNDVKADFANLVGELNQEECGNVFVCSFSDADGKIGYKNQPECLCLKFDKSARLITIQCDAPIVFKYFMSVRLRLASGETSWYYVAGKKENELNGCRNDINVIVNEAMYALVGVSREGFPL
jgi:hypothetical protein